MKLRTLLDYIYMKTLICVRKNGKEYRRTREGVKVYRGTREDVIADNIWLDHEIIRICILKVTEEEKETEPYIYIEVEE